MGTNAENARNNNWTLPELDAVRWAYGKALAEAASGQVTKVHARAAEFLGQAGVKRSLHAIQCKAGKLGIVVDPNKFKPVTHKVLEDPLYTLPPGSFLSPGESPGNCRCGGSSWYYDKIFREWACWNCGTVKYVTANRR